MYFLRMPIAAHMCISVEFPYVYLCGAPNQLPAERPLKPITMQIYYKLPSAKVKLLRGRESNAAHMSPIDLDTVPRAIEHQGFEISFHSISGLSYKHLNVDRKNPA